MWARLSDRFLGNPLIRRVLKNSAYLFSASGIAIGLNFFQNLLVANMLGPLWFGVLGAIVKFTSVINKLLSFRMNELVVKYIGEFEAQDDHPRAAALFKVATGVELVSSVLSFGAILWLAPLAAQFLAKDIATTEWFALYGLIVLGNFMFESASGLLQISDRFRHIATLQVIQSATTLSLIVIVFFSGGDLFEIVLAYMAGKLVNGSGMSFMALREARRMWGAGWWRARIGLLNSARQEMVRFAVNTNISATINLVNKDSEELWVSFFRGPLEAGYYKQALALSNLVLLPVAPLPQATYPELSREAARENWSNLRYVIRQGSRLALTYSAIAAAALLIFGRPFIARFYGEEFLPAYPAMAILLVGLLVANTFYWNRTTLLALGRADYPTKVNAIAAVLKVALALLLIPKAGYLASAALLSAYYIFSIGLNVWKGYAELAEREARTAETAQGSA
jgi:O-antigen/teichoic acid export membrane protein